MDEIRTDDVQPVAASGTSTLYFWLIVALHIIVVVAVFFIAASHYGWWPYDSTPAPAVEATPSASPTPTGTPDATAQWDTYENPDRDISFRYPPGLYDEVDESLSAFEHIDSFGTSLLRLGNAVTEGTGMSISILHAPLNPTAIPDLYGPIADADVVTVNGRTWYEHHTGDAGCAAQVATTKYRNNEILQVSFAVCEPNAPQGTPYGDAELRHQILGTFSIDLEAAPPVLLPDVPYSAKNFTLSFLLPEGVEIEDSPNSLLFSYGPLARHEIGSDNAFMRILRLTGDRATERKQAESQFRQLTDNVHDRTAFLDGFDFVRLEGTDRGKYEGTSAGEVIAVFFDTSYLSIEERPGNADLPFDVIPTALHILQSFKFSKNGY